MSTGICLAVFVVLGPVAAWLFWDAMLPRLTPREQEYQDRIIFGRDDEEAIA